MANKSLERVAELAATLSRFHTASDGADGDRRVVSATEIVRALDEFQECVRYLNTRRSKGAVLQLTDEGAIQDVLYLMLRPWIHDLKYENPTDRVGNAFFSIKDFLIPQARSVLEAKFVRDKEHGKRIAKELYEDIETYRIHPLCDTLIFFVYDPDQWIPDQSALIAHIEAARAYDGRGLTCRLVIKP